MSLLRRAAVVLSASAALLAVALPAQAKTPPGWRVNKRVMAAGGPVMTAIAALRRSDAWAMGFNQPTKNSINGIIERWTGKAWHRVQLPVTVAANWDMAPPIATMSASSDSNLWAFSLLPPAEYLRRSGTQWSTGFLPVPMQGDDLYVGVGIARSSTDVWALGGVVQSNALHPYAARFNGTSWSMVPVPGSGPIVAASVLSNRDIWAVIGTRAVEGSLITTKTPAVLHWNGSSWKKVTLHGKLPGNPSSILAKSDRNVWIGGGSRNRKGGTSEFVAQYTGSALHVKKLPVPASTTKFQVIRLVNDGHGGIWGLTDNQNVSTWRLWHRTSTGWHGPMRPDFGRDSLLFSMARVPGTSSLWGVGALGRDGLIAVEGKLP